MKAVIRKDAGGPGRLLGWPGLVVTAVCRHLTPGLLSRAVKVPCAELRGRSLPGPAVCTQPSQEATVPAHQHLF